MTDNNSDKESGEKRGVLGSDRAKQLDKTKDDDSDDSESETEDGDDAEE